MAITHQTDYLGDARAKQLEQYKLLPRMDAVLQSYMQEIQAAEDAAWDVFYHLCLQNNPTGDLLAKLGALVGQSSLGLSDALYVQLISARILTNQSTGRRGQLVTITILLASSSAPPIVVRDLQPACVYIEPYGPIVISPYIIVGQFLGQAVEAGVALAFVWTKVARAATLTFGSIYAPGFAVASNVCTNTGITAAQSMGSIYHSGFTVTSNVVVSDGGGVLAGVVGV